MTESQSMPNPFDALGRMFGESGEVRASLARQAEGFWHAQQEVLDGLEGLTRAWFQRRHRVLSQHLCPHASNEP